MTDLYDIKNLTFTYPRQDAPSLRSLSFCVHRGEFLVVCGKSGCGKSTLMRQFKTAVMPYGRSEGQVLFDGRPLDSISVREQAERIGYVYQSPDNQIVTDRVWHELAFGMENLGFAQEVIRLRVAEMASFFGIQGWFMKSVEELSGGQKQLLNLAGVMAMQPDVLMLDEPTSQLDPLAAADFLATLRKINTELGTTIILIEHRLEDVLAYADRVMVMEGGRILALEAPKKLGNVIRGNDMFLAMPVPMRVFDALGGQGDCPVTVREGHQWLGDRLQAAGWDPSGQREAPSGPEEVPFGQREPLRQSGWSGRKKKQVPLIRAKNVWFRYEKDGPDIVRDLNMEVMQGELYCILGGNGTGKTTTLSLLGSLCQPHRGRILLGGKPLSAYGSELRDQILGILPQNPQLLFVRDTVREDLEEMLNPNPLIDRIFSGKGKAAGGKKTAAGKASAGQRKAAGGMGPEERERIRQAADLMEISHLLDAHPYDLSGGEQQRAVLAKLLLKDPDILLLDEPTKGMDGFYKQKLAGILRQLIRERGKTIIMVSHDIEFCAQYADTCALFFNGGIVSSGPAKSFFAGNSFYTTVANRMARKWFPDAVTTEDVVEAMKKTGGSDGF